MSIARASAILLALALAACPASEQPDGVKGREGLAMFQAEIDLAFSSTLVVGSSTLVGFVEATKDEPLPDGAVLRSANDALLTVGEVDEDGKAPVGLIAAGEADLELAGPDGALLDAIAMKAAVPGATTLVDGDLLGASQVVDARLPADNWGFLVDRELTLLVSAVDRCGGDLLDLHASTVHTAEGTPASVIVTAAAPATFTAKATEAIDVELVLETPGLDPLSYPVQSLEGGAVDEVRVAAASADDAGNMSLWGRAFSNDVEIVGPLRFSWRADPRVALSAVEGLAVDAQVALPGDGEPPDDRPATVTAEVLGEEGTLDLFTAHQQAERGAPARAVVVEAVSSSGCGADPCDPFAAAGLLAAVVLRRRLTAVRTRLTRTQLARPRATRAVDG